MESIAQILIYIHAFFGSVALLTGMGAIISRKGASFHRKSGKKFVLTMAISAFTAVIIALLPGHFSPFLFAIGIFSSYFLVIGYRALDYKRKDHNFKIDLRICQLMILICFGMLTLPLLINGSINIVLSVFGGFGLLSAFTNLNRFRNPESLQTDWLQLHLGNITGAYIAAVSAFFVVNNILPGLLNWFAPGIVGGLFIAYWINRVASKKSKFINETPPD